MREFIGGDWGSGRVWLVHRAPVPNGAAPGTMARPQNWPLARVARGTEATFSRLPGVERVPSFTIELVDQWVSDANAVEHGGSATRKLKYVSCWLIQKFCIGSLKIPGPTQLEQINFISWNIWLLKCGEVDDFLIRMTGTCPDWGILLSRELHNGAREFWAVSRNSRSVFAATPQTGCAATWHYRVHKKLNKYILPSTFGHVRRADCMVFFSGTEP